MGCELEIAKQSLISLEGQLLPKISIDACSYTQRHRKRRHYMPGMSPPFRKQLRFLIFVFMLVMPSQKNSAKPLPAFNYYKIVLSARAPFFGGVGMPIFATGYQMR
jgi:hypothetical protein